jgi:hypothetical protein
MEWPQTKVTELLTQQVQNSQNYQAEDHGIRPNTESHKQKEHAHPKQ